MNGSFYQNPTFPSLDIPNNQTPPGNISYDSTLGEQSYIENILRLNKGKRVKVYYSYPDSTTWQNMVYNGIIEEAGKDHLIIRDAENNNYYLLRLIYLDYVEFMERIVYSHIYSEKTY